MVWWRREEKKKKKEGGLRSLEKTEVAAKSTERKQSGTDRLTHGWTDRRMGGGGVHVDAEAVPERKHS